MKPRVQIVFGEYRIVRQAESVTLEEKQGTDAMGGQRWVAVSQDDWCQSRFHLVRQLSNQLERRRRRARK